MFTLKFTTVRFFNFSGLVFLPGRKSLKKMRFWGRPFALLVLLVCYFHFGREKIWGISIKNCRIIYIMEFSQEKSLEDFLRILFSTNPIISQPWTPPVIVPINEVKIALNTVLQFIGRILLAVSAKCTNSNCFGPKSTGWEATTK